jgi:PST family polysaccharide transporter
MKDSGDLTGQVKRAYGWTLGNRLTSEAVAFGIGIVLARLLLPEDFGVYAITLIFTEISSTLLVAGFVGVLIRQTELEPRTVETTLFLQLVIGSVCAAALALIAPLVGGFYREELLTPVLRAVGLTFLLSPFVAVPTALLRRRMNFRPLFFGGIVRTCTYGVVSISLALSGFGVWSIVWGRIASQVTCGLTLSTAARWLPRARLHREIVRPTLLPALLFAAKAVLPDLVANTSRLIVGRLLGLEALGFFERAWSLIALPATRLIAGVSYVLFPAFSTIQDQPERLRRGFVKGTYYVASVILPSLAGLYLVAPSFIEVVYGAKWLPAAPLVRIMCLAGLLAGLLPPMISVTSAKGLLRQEIIRHLAHLGVLAVGVSIGSRWGLDGVAWGVVAGALVIYVLLLRLVTRSIELPVARYVAAIAPLAAATLALVLAVGLTRWALIARGDPSETVLLIASIAVGVPVYVTAVLVFDLRREGSLGRQMLSDLSPRLHEMLSRVQNRRWGLRRSLR